MLVSTVATDGLVRKPQPTRTRNIAWKGIYMIGFQSEHTSDLKLI